MELRHLRYFVAVAEEQNVTRAAARLRVSQPPLSRQIRDLEHELGVELFRRTAKSVALTEAGKVFLNEARAVLLRADTAVQTVRALADGDRRRLRVGYAPSLTAELLPRALRLFEQESPGVRVALHDLSSEECMEKLITRKIDLALTVRPATACLSGLVFEKLIAYPVCCALAATHPFAAKRALRLEQLRGEKFIVYTEDEYPEYHAWLRKLCRASGFEPRALEEYNGVSGLMAAVEAGNGVALVTASIRHLAGPRLKLIPLATEIPPLALGALAPRPPSATARAFLAALRQAVRAA